MFQKFMLLHPIVQAFIAGLFTWGMTAIGAGAVFLTREVNKKLLDTMLGFAAGVMIAASYWSLLEPALTMGEDGPLPNWVPAAIGFMLGGIFLRIIDAILPHLHPRSSHERSRRCTYLLAEEYLAYPSSHYS